MSLSTTERDLKRIFGEYGEIETVQLVYDRYSGRSRGFGFVYFESTRDAIRASSYICYSNALLKCTLCKPVFEAVKRHKGYTADW